ncbi:MAG: serine--tRNA ligase [Planctomycetota bacterium]|jgi:seryl-tRNA synthetase
MIDIKEIRQDPQLFKDAAKAKGFDVDIDALVEVDNKLKSSKQRLQDISTEKNRIGKSIPKLSGEEKQSALATLANLKIEDEQCNNIIKQAQPDFDSLMLQVPQPADDDVPLGKDDTQNVEIRKEGQVRKFDFEPKDHVELGLSLGIIDIERGVKIAGSRNYFLKGDGALLHWAILQFAVDSMISKGYTPLSVPLLAKDETMRGTGYFPGSEDQTYQMERDKLSLVGTAEVPLTAYHSGEILKSEQLPRKYIAMSSCFRREAGAAGKDTHGLYRIHQFDKVEQVIVCKNDPDESAMFHDEILSNAEGMMQALELPYRIVNVCSGDLGRGQAKKFDIEAWMPSRKGYCETHSASKFYEFQARRMNLRYKDQETKKNIFCHTLNNTVIASPRILIPILELYQNADGSVTIPFALRPYMQNKDKISSGG